MNSVQSTVENSTANIAEDMGSFLGLTFNQIFFTIDRSLKLMGALLQFFLSAFRNYVATTRSDGLFRSADTLE